jgi:hypothetical protein
MNYKTYISAAELAASYKQFKLSKDFIEHAIFLEKKRIEDLSFSVLVGVRHFKNAKYDYSRLIKESKSNTLMIIFKSDDNTHRLNLKINEFGSMSWIDGNLFSNRKSVNNFEKLIRNLSKYQNDLVHLLKNNSLKPEDLKVVSRTFYN